MKRKTIRNHKDFFTTRDGPGIANSCCVIKIKPAKIPDDARYGIIATKRLFKLAVTRNRAKRIARDWIAFNEDLMMDSMDYIFILREPILNCNRDLGRQKMAHSLEKLSKIYSDDAK